MIYLHGVSVQELEDETISARRRPTFSGGILGESIAKSLSPEFDSMNWLLDEYITGRVPSIGYSKIS